MDGKEKVNSAETIDEGGENSTPLPERKRRRQIATIVELERLCMDNPWDEVQIASHLQNPATLTLFIHDDGGIGLPANGEEAEIVGHALILLSPLQGEAEILRLGVRPTRRRRGLGLRLLLQIENAVIAAGDSFQRILLEVSTGNVAARRLYGKSDYREIRRRRGYYNDGSDAIVLEKKIVRPGGQS